MDYLSIEAAENALYTNDLRKDNARQYVALREEDFGGGCQKIPLLDRIQQVCVVFKEAILFIFKVLLSFIALLLDQGRTVVLF